MSQDAHHETRPGRPGPCAARPLPALACALAAPPCFSPIKEPVERTALHQQVTTAAVDDAISALDLASLDRSATWAVLVTAPRATDESWIRAALRARLRAEGLRVASQPGEATQQMQVVVPYAGSDLQTSLFGIPVFVPGLPFSFGDISLYKSSTLTGRAALRPQVTTAPGARASPTAETPAREGDGGERLVTQLGEAHGSRYFKNLTFLTFIGPFIRTDLERFEEPGNEDEEAETPLTSSAPQELGEDEEEIH